MNDMKMKLLQSLIDKMDESSADEIRGKMPKVAAVDIASNDPNLANSLKDKLIGESQNDTEGPLESLREESPMGEKPEMDEGSMRKLMELYKEMC